MENDLNENIEKVLEVIMKTSYSDDYIKYISAKFNYWYKTSVNESQIVAEFADYCAHVFTSRGKLVVNITHNPGFIVKSWEYDSITDFNVNFAMAEAVSFVMETSPVERELFHCLYG